jgi:protein gp37
MGTKTKIEWCDHTFNPWRGCTKVSPGCANCYAETQAKRNPSVLGVWGDRGTRVVASEYYWQQPLKWDRDGLPCTCGADRTGPSAEAHDADCQTRRRPRVFCASMADVFEDRPELVRPRDRLFGVIRDTPHLDWLLLTKRPENFRILMTASMAPWPNVWLGVSVEDQARADERIPILLETPAAVRFLSVEPLIGLVDLTRHLFPEPIPASLLGRPHSRGIDWTIIGGESGPGARRCDTVWIQRLVEQCKDAGVACFVKQLGAHPLMRNGVKMRLVDKKGGDPAEWPADLCVREFPTQR